MKYNGFFETINCINYNKELAVKKNLVVNDNYTLYYNMSELYKKILLSIVFEKIISFSILDDFKKCNLFMPLNDKEFVKFDIVNFLFIEKLNEKDIDTFRRYLINTDTEYSELVGIVKNTYKEVVKNNYINNQYIDEKIKIGFNSTNIDELIDNDKIVISLTYNTKTNINDKSQFIDITRRRRKFLNWLKLKVETNGGENIALIYYGVVIAK